MDKEKVVILDCVDGTTGVQILDLYIILIRERLLEGIEDDAVRYESGQCFAMGFIYMYRPRCDGEDAVILTCHSQCGCVSTSSDIIDEKWWMTSCDPELPDCCDIGVTCSII